MMFVELVLFPDVQEDVQAAKRANGEARNIDDTEGLVPCKESDSCFQIVLNHKL